MDPGLRWRTLETANFHVHFAEQHRSQARVVAGTAERLLPRITGLLRWKPESRIQLVVLDSADFANGLASPIPFNFTMIFLSPPDEGELLQNREWLEMVLAHELFHIVHMDMARSAPRVLRNIFGRQIFTFPNALSPGWIVEGLAVHYESDSRLGHGRLNNSYFDGMMRAEASRGLRTLSEIHSDGRGFPLNRDYLYGAYFFAFLQEIYGQRAITDFIENYSDNIIPFRVHSNPHIVTGKNMNQLWDDYRAWLMKRFGTGRADVQEGEVLARDFSLSSPALAPDGTRWYVRADGYTRPQLVRERPGEKAQAVREVEHGARLASLAEGSVLVAQYEICDNYNYYYDLYRTDARGRTKRLTDCGRYRFAAPLDDGRTVALRVEAGQSQAVLLDQQGKVAQVLYRAAPGEALTGVAAKGSSVVLTSVLDGRWSLIGITEGGSQRLLTDQAIKHSPRIGDRDEVFFIADYGKIFDVWSLARGGQLLRWTQSAHGVRDISAPRGGEMLLTTIEADGDALRLHRLPAQPLEQLSALAPAVAEPPEPPSAGQRERPYSPWHTLAPRNWQPLIEVVDGARKFGVAVFGQDALARHQYVLAPLYETTQKEFLGTIAYLYNDRHLFLFDRSMRVKDTVTTEDEDSFGSDKDVRTYTINEMGQWISTWRWLALNRRFFWGGGGALERERLKQVDGPTLRSDDDERVFGLVAGFDSRRTQWLAEGPSQGLQVRLFAETSHGLGGTYSGDVYRVDARWHLPLGRTVLGLRWNEAWGEPDAEAFELGGHWPDPGFILPILNQREFALRGYRSGEPALTGHRARLVTTELRVPISDIDRAAMVPPVGINRVAVNLFVDVGAAWEPGGSADHKRGAGVELMSEIRFFYIAGVQARLGWAKGVDAPGLSRFYLTVGRSF